MAIVTEFSLTQRARVISGQGQRERRFLDFVFDSIPVYETVSVNGFDYTTPIWLGAGECSRSALQRLLGESTPDAPEGRVSVYVCPECADLGCGSITVSIVRSRTTVSWRRWGYQNNYEAGIHDLPAFGQARATSTRATATTRLNTTNDHSPNGVRSSMSEPRLRFHTQVRPAATKPAVRPRARTDQSTMDDIRTTEPPGRR